MDHQSQHVTGPTTAAGTTTIRVEVPLVSGEAETAMLPGELVYDVSDPYAVTLHVTTRKKREVTWTFARELLAEGLFEPSGHGDVQVWPCLSTTAEAVIVVELHAPDGDAILQAPSRIVQPFVAEIYRVVPEGQEARHLQLDSLVEQLLAD